MRTVKPDQPTAPKLTSFLVCNVGIYYEPYNKLLDILKERGLKGLSVRSCRAPTLECKKELEGLVENIVWENVRLTRGGVSIDFAYWST